MLQRVEIRRGFGCGLSWRLPGTYAMSALRREYPQQQQALKLGLHRDGIQDRRASRGAPVQA